MNSKTNSTKRNMKASIKWAVATTLAASGALGGGIGCDASGPKISSGNRQSQPSFTLPPTREAATSVLVTKLPKFDQDISMFPGTTGAEHRQALVTTLDDLNELLRLINGPDISPGFNNCLETITNAANAASNQSIPRARMEALENQALHATGNALSELSRRYLLDSDQLPGAVEAMNAKVASTAQSQGPMHDLDATDAFNAVAAVIHRMSDDLAAMMPEAPPAMPQPMAPVPESPTLVPAVPATAPATQPSSAPAPMPSPTPTP